MSIENNVNLMGRLTRDLEVGFTQKNKMYGKTSIAVNKSYKGENGEWVNQTMFVDLIAWGDKTVNYLKDRFKKGILVAINGELEINNYVAKDGNKRISVSVRILNSKVLEPKKTVNSGAEGSNNYTPTFEPANDFGANNIVTGENPVNFNDFSPIDDDDNIPF